MTKITLDTDNVKNYIADLSRQRDELKLKIHLAAKDMQDEWRDAEKKWEKFSHDAKLQESGKNMLAALEALGSELKGAYTHIRKAL
jgi:hypothetical protein